MSQSFEPMTVISLVSLAVLCALALKKMLVTDRFHALRVVLLTALLWSVMLYLFFLAYPPRPYWPNCMPPDTDDGVYTITEM